MHAAREHHLLASLGGVRLHDADASHRLRQPPGDIRVDDAALAEDGAELRERVRHRAAEDEQQRERDERELPVEPEEDAEREHGGDESAAQLHETRADEIPDPFGVGHDARDEDAALRGVEVADGQPKHVLLHLLAHVGDRALGGDAHDLRQGERRRRLDERRAGGRERERNEQVGALLSDDVVDEELRARREHQPREPVDEHEREADRELTAVRPDEGARLLPDVGEGGLLFLRVGGHSVQSNRGIRDM